MRAISTLNGTTRDRSKRMILFAIWIVAWSFSFTLPVLSLIRYCLENENASHILLIPFICAWILYLERQSTFRRIFYDFPVAAFFLVLAVGLYCWTIRFEGCWSARNSLTAHVVLLLLLWIAGFALFFGREAVKTARFSLLLLLLAAPLPDFILNRSILYLQEGSAAVTAVLFDLTGVTVLREGFIFHLGRVSIEIAKECSGIRSSMALLILALLAAHFFLLSFWRKTVFVLIGVPLMIVKNGIRIVALTLLALYVDPRFLFGRLHHYGGVVFFLLALLLYVPSLRLLQWSERRGEKTP